MRYIRRMVDIPEQPGDRLGEAAVLAERGFLAAGQSLEGAMGILDRLIQRFADCMAGLAGRTLDETHRDLAAAGTHIAKLDTVRRQDADALDALGTIVAAADRRVAALEPITREVAALSLSARVVAGGIGLGAADFVAFAGSIRDAAGQARLCLEEARLALRRVDQDVNAARAEAAAFARCHGGAIGAIPARLADNLHSLAEQQSLATGAADAARQRSEEMRQQVAGQIVALQLGDITRQRLEHARAAALLAVRPCRLVADLLAAQLLDTADELVREGERIEQGLRQLVGTARAIGALGVQVHGETRHGGFAAALEVDIRDTAALFAEVSTGDAATDQRMGTVLDAAAALTGRLANVQSVQEDIRIMGLNATLKCGRLGSVGRPLAAVAQELRACSGRFGANAGSVLQDLDRLRPIAAGLRDPARRGEHAEIVRMTDAMPASLRRLGRLEQELVRALAELQADTDEVACLVDAAVAQFGVRHTLADMLREVAADLTSRTGTEDAAGAADNEAVGATLDRIATAYTMAREREVHLRFAPLPLAAATEEFADVLF
ncbi:MAG: hypothetical protein WDN25_13040 [Acetobacteraceae bacterium]